MDNLVGSTNTQLVEKCNLCDSEKGPFHEFHEVVLCEWCCDSMEGDELAYIYPAYTGQFGMKDER